MILDDNFTMIPNKLFFRTIDGKSAEGLIKLYHDDKILLIYDCLEHQRLRCNKSAFTLEFLITYCGYKVNRREGKSVDQFKETLFLLSEAHLISNMRNAVTNDKITTSDIAPKDYVWCDLNIIEGSFIQLHKWEKDKILKYNKEPIDNLKMLTYYCYLKARMYRRSKKSSDRVVTGGRNEVAYPSYSNTKDDLGLSESSITKYNKVLADLDMIRYDNAGLHKKKEDDAPTESRNTYILYKEGWEDDLKDSIKFYKNTMESEGCTFIDFNDKIEIKKINGFIGRINYLEKIGKATDKQISKRDDYIADKNNKV